MAYLIHLANVLVLMSFLVRDILWLRLLSIFGGLAFVGYFGFALKEPLYAPVVWNLIFCAINVIQIARLVAQRRPVFLNAQHQRVHQLAFHALTPRELTKLLAIGSWETQGDAIIEVGETPNRLMMLCEGDAHVQVGDRRVATLQPGQFAGEMAWLTGRAASAQVRPLGEVTLVAWPFEQLRRLLDEHPNICTVFQRQLGADLARKLRN